MLANAIKESGLHEKISLKIIMLFGSDPKWLLLGIMLTTAFLSLWVSNNASAAIMMFPPTMAVVKQLVKLNKPISSCSKTSSSGSYLNFRFIIN